MAATYHTDPSRRPRSSHKVIVSTPAMEHQEFFLRHHAVLLQVVDKTRPTNPMAVGRALEALLHIPSHVLRVTYHHPEEFFVHFDFPAHHDNAIRHGSVTVDDATFRIKAWQEDDHATHDNFNLHVRVVIEDLPMQLWSLEGAEEAMGDKCRVDRLDSRTFERGTPKRSHAGFGCGTSPTS